MPHTLCYTAKPDDDDMCAFIRKSDGLILYGDDCEDSKKTVCFIKGKKYRQFNNVPTDYIINSFVMAEYVPVYSRTR